MTITTWWIIISLKLLRSHKQIQHLQQRLSINYVAHAEIDENAHSELILNAEKQHEIIRETALANAVVNGKLWNSLGSKKSIQQQVRVKTKI